VQAVLGEMVERREGHVVAIGGAAARIGAPYEAGYSASKFAVVGFVEGLAAEVRPFGVRCALVHPGPVATEFAERAGGPSPEEQHRRLIAPAKVADAVVHAVEHDRFEQVVPPRALFKGVKRAAAPRYYRWDVDRDFAAESSALETRLDLRDDQR
jgi:short-subunit dehydrogenase